MGRKYEDGEWRAGRYLANAILPVVASMAREGFDAKWSAGVANLPAAVFYGGLDFLGRVSDTARDSKFMRMAKVPGLIYFAGATVYDLISLASGDNTSWPNVICDASMAYQNGKDTYNSYGREGEDIMDDFPFIKTLVAKGKNLAQKIASSVRSSTSP